MKRSRHLVESVAPDPISAYLHQCRVKSMMEDEETHVPPTAAEVRELIGYLRTQGSKPAIVGGVGVLHHLGPGADFRPTVDVDVWVQKLPKLKPGWKQDPEAVGVSSWISPSGGYVDFLTPGHEINPDTKLPRTIDVDAPDSDFPVGTWQSLAWLKLNSVREKDLADLIALVRKAGRVPTKADFKKFGAMNSTQKENLEMVQQWFKLRPTGGYGE